MKKLWDTTAFSTGEGNGPKSKAAEVFSTYFLTILLSIFLLIVVSILGIVLWTSNGGSDQKQAEQAFYDPSKTSASVTSSASSNAANTASETMASSETTTSSSAATSENTLTVQAGEGAGSIAARAGISVERLYELNPDKMVGPDGTWWANPGDTVNVN